MDNKRAPVQGWAAGIPWELHLEAYSAYCKKYGPQQALIEGGCRGGFATGELDMFIPGWRERASRTAKVETVLRKLVHEWDSWSAGDEPLGDERLENLVEEARTALGFTHSGEAKS